MYSTVSPVVKRARTPARVPGSKTMYPNLMFKYSRIYSYRTGQYGMLIFYYPTSDVRRQAMHRLDMILLQVQQLPVLHSAALFSWDFSVTTSRSRFDHMQPTRSW
jgi:hypothetical protein